MRSFSCLGAAAAILLPLLLAACSGGGGEPADTRPPITAASPAAGTYAEPQSVSLTCTDGDGSGCFATFYTTDGGEPTQASTPYGGPIAVAADTTLRFFSVDNAGNEEVERGTVASLPEVTSWISANRGPLEQRRASYDALATALVVPDVRIERDASRPDRQARGADYLGHYPGALLAELAPALSPFVRLEVGRARVVPHVHRALGSFVHTQLERTGMLGQFSDNRPARVRCVHPLVSLFEKLDAMARRYARAELQPDTFIRHYEDAAQIIRAAATLPELGMSVGALAKDMLAKKDIAELPRPDQPALTLPDSEKRAALDRAHARIAPMYWGKRIPLTEACETIQTWLGAVEWSG